jgi:hypothetical protein
LIGVVNTVNRRRSAHDACHLHPSWRCGWIFFGGFR